LPPIATENPTGTRLRRLLQSARRHVWAEPGLDSNNLCNPKALWPHQYPVALLVEDLCGFSVAGKMGNRINKRLTVIVHATRVIPTEQRRAMPTGVVLHRDTVMDPILIGGQDRPRH